ncbi:MAG: hypothetical protein JNM56_31410 [Planctomycetia bacterium]|nr:hypothetical protein [Planctomycetia bacterium]
MAEAANALATLARLGDDPLSGVHLQPIAGEAAIRRMQSAARRDLGEPVPDEYAALLRVTNGVQINGAYFKSAEHLVPENLDVPRPEIIVLGTEGNMAEYVFDRRDRRFHTINMGFPDERFASFGSFEELLAAVLHDQQVL